jgi:hypothetical protein
MTKEAWSRREFAALAASGALGGAAAPGVAGNRWANPFPGSDVIAPPAGPSAAELWGAFQATAASQAAANVRQLWGNAVQLPTQPTATQPSNMQEVINLGPWKEPRAVCIEYQLSYLAGQANGASGGVLSLGNNPMCGIIWNLNIGIGNASVVQSFTRPPPVIMCTSLVVSVQRYDTNAIGWVLNAWAAPYVPRSQPQVIDSVAVTMGGGTGSQVIGGPPALATHVMMTMDQLDTVDQNVFLVIPFFQDPASLGAGSPTPPTTGTWRALMYQKFGATPASGGWSQAQPIPLPANVAGQARVDRSSFGVGFDVNVHWLRC